MKYIKKPVVIEAFKMGIDSHPDWFQDKVTDGSVTTHLVTEKRFNDPFQFQETYCLIYTLEGVMKGNYGDYIIKGVQKEIYPCKPDIFEKTYEIVSE